MSDPDEELFAIARHNRELQERIAELEAFARYVRDDCAHEGSVCHDRVVSLVGQDS